MVDMDRIEVLEGPQGTLFGAVPRRGEFRYNHQQTESSMSRSAAEGGYGITAHGDPNTSANVVLNLPLIDDSSDPRA